MYEIQGFWQDEKRKYKALQYKGTHKVIHDIYYNTEIRYFMKSSHRTQDCNPLTAAFTNEDKD